MSTEEGPDKLKPLTKGSSTSTSTEKSSNTSKDCLGCRIVGSLTGLGVGGYGLYERSKITGIPLPASAKRHRQVLLGLSMGNLLGIYIYFLFKKGG